jgi:Cu(I)/Ag(I) efflux system protein CusF
MKYLTIPTALVFFVFSCTSYADDMHGLGKPKLVDMPAVNAMSPESAGMEMTKGVIRKIDLEQGKVTLKHDEIKNLSMLGMTMVFNVTSPAILQGFKAGDIVKFTAERVEGKLTVTAIEKDAGSSE